MSFFRNVNHVGLKHAHSENHSRKQSLTLADHETLLPLYKKVWKPELDPNLRRQKTFNQDETKIEKKLDDLYMASEV